ncbi:hypothetical protein BGZ65_006498 [Modicella reniformis]|uniref:Complex 1 LYR protein domain-containing protein n=1 Tax=Modicella reniformis TaxID=1440133 RepID=A0A9P6INW9_9FUNG|nr:hypothetical protein BGZ65_006498 [Modicella reniformis]
MTGSRNVILSQSSKRVLELYRRLLRIGKTMPTATRSSLVLSRVRSDFRANKLETDPQEIENMIQLAEVQVDNLEIQRDHLTELSKNPNLIIPVDIHKDAKPRASRFMKGPSLSWERKAAQEIYLEKNRTTVVSNVEWEGSGITDAARIDKVKGFFIPNGPEGLTFVNPIDKTLRELISQVGKLLAIARRCKEGAHKCLELIIPLEEKK